jgi:hypothetical protein
MCSAHSVALTVVAKLATNATLKVLLITKVTPAGVRTLAM